MIDLSSVQGIFTISAQNALKLPAMSHNLKGFLNLTVVLKFYPLLIDIL